MANSTKVRPWDTKKGDRILGTSLVITGKHSYSEGDIGSNAERQLYTLPLFHTEKEIETSITYNADSWVFVIRPEDDK
jgi:hypothetical protein